MDCNLPGSSVHGISQERILECVAFPFQRDLPDPGSEPVSPALAGRFFSISATFGSIELSAMGAFKHVLWWFKGKRECTKKGFMVVGP